MKKLLEMIREYTEDVILKDFRANDRDQDELTFGEVRHAVRKLKEMTDSDYDTLRREAFTFDENAHPDNVGGHSSESSATEEYRGQRGVLDFQWPDELVAQVCRFRKSTLALIRPRFRSKKHKGFLAKSPAARAAQDGRQTLRPKVEVPREASAANPAGLSLHAARKSTGQFFDNAKGQRSATGDRDYPPAQENLRSKPSNSKSGAQECKIYEPKPSKKP
jgi:hypothetical protein